MDTSSTGDPDEKLATSRSLTRLGAGRSRYGVLAATPTDSSIRVSALSIRFRTQSKARGMSHHQTRRAMLRPSLGHHNHASRGALVPYKCSICVQHGYLCATAQIPSLIAYGVELRRHLVWLSSPSGWPSK
jgi:hypothetical protein